MTGGAVAPSHYFAVRAKNDNPLHGKELSMSNSKKMQGRMGRFGVFSRIVPVMAGVGNDPGPIAFGPGYSRPDAGAQRGTDVATT